MIALQESLRKWHELKFPAARASDIGMKLAEETGEVCRALDRMLYAKTDEENMAWAMNLEEELGDVAIVLMVLATRYHLNFEEIVERRASEVMSR